MQWNSFGPGAGGRRADRHGRGHLYRGRGRPLGSASRPGARELEPPRKYEPSVCPVHQSCRFLDGRRAKENKTKKKNHPIALGVPAASSRILPGGGQETEGMLLDHDWGGGKGRAGKEAVELIVNSFLETPA